MQTNFFFLISISIPGSRSKAMHVFFTLSAPMCWKTCPFPTSDSSLSLSLISPPLCKSQFFACRRWHSAYRPRRRRLNVHLTPCLEMAPACVCESSISIPFGSISPRTLLGPGVMNGDVNLVLGLSHLSLSEVFVIGNSSPVVVATGPH